MSTTPAFPIASGKKKVVQVFECPQETWKSKRNGSTSRPARAQSQNGEVSLGEEIKKEFNDALQSVKEFAAENLKGKEKKQHEAKRIELLGGERAKNRSTPYHILSALKKARVVRDARKEVLSKQADVINGKKTRGKASKKKEKKKNVDFGVQATRGNFRNGMLNVSKLV